MIQSNPNPVVPGADSFVLCGVGRCLGRRPVLPGWVPWSLLSVAAWLGSGVPAPAASYGHSGSIVLGVRRVQASPAEGIAHAGEVVLARKRAQSSDRYLHDGRVTPSPRQSAIVLPLAVRDLFQIVYPSVRTGGSRFSFWLTTKPGVRYQIQRSSDFGMWIGLRELRGVSAAVEVHDVPPADGKPYFYKAVELSD
ncbi:MAG: hypothetical protein AB7O66_14840 [Limisphaerales bacterium]